MNNIIYSPPQSCESCSAPLQSYLSLVEDRVYGAQGSWDIKRCSSKRCQVMYLDAALSAAQIASFYATYSTHSDPVLHATGVKRLYRDALASIYSRKLGYTQTAGFAAAVLGRALSLLPFFRQAALARAFWLPQKTDGEALEIGFGNAQSLLQLKAQGWNVSGVEYDAVCIEKARQRGVSAFEGDFAGQNFVPESFDAIVGSHVIEHVPDPGGLMADIWEALRPGGIMVMVTPNGQSLGSALFSRHWRGLETPRHLTVQTCFSLETHARKAGFGEVRTFGTPHGGFILQQSTELALKQQPSARQGIGTLFYNVVASLINLVTPKKSEEIVLFCVK